METTQIRKTEPADAAFLYMEDEKTHAHGTFIFFYEPDSTSEGRSSGFNGITFLSELIQM